MCKSTRRKPAPDGVAKAVVKSAHRLVARHYGLPQSLMRFDRRIHEDKTIHLARKAALYLAVCSRNLHTRAVGRAAGCSHVYVHRCLQTIEDKRDDPEFDRTLEQLEMELMAC